MKYSIHFDFKLFFFAVSILLTKIEIYSLHSVIPFSKRFNLSVKGTLLIIFSAIIVSLNSLRGILSL